MPAHVRAALTQVHLAVPVQAGEPLLGTWQGIYLYEHRRHGHARQVVLHLLGEGKPSDRGGGWRREGAGG